jgi:hypothetical protein
MLYKKINVEPIVATDEAEAIVAELNAALDRLEERPALFGGGIETVAAAHPGTRRDRHSRIRRPQVRRLRGLYVRP